MSDLFALSERPVRDVQAAIEEEVTNANITINEGIGASQYGTGIVSTRLAEAVLRDEGAVSPVSAHQLDYGQPFRARRARSLWSQAHSAAAHDR